MSGGKSSQPADVWLPSVNRIDNGEHNGGNTTLRRADQNGGDATSRTEMSPERGESGSDMSKQPIPVGTELSGAGDTKPESIKIEERPLAHKELEEGESQKAETEGRGPQSMHDRGRRSSTGGQEASHRIGRLIGGNGQGGQDPSRGPPVGVLNPAFVWPPYKLRQFCQRMDISKSPTLPLLYISAEIKMAKDGG
jgi:hypothetical protein